MRISTVNYGPLAPSYTSVLHADNKYPLEPLPMNLNSELGVLEREAEIEKRAMKKEVAVFELLGNGMWSNIKS